MKFRELKLKGVYLVEIKAQRDERGFFARRFCEEEFRKLGLRFKVRQSNLSFNQKKGTLRGLHFQKAPSADAKLVSCPKGAIYDVVVDLRPGSPTFGKWIAQELTEDNRLMLYVPEGCAHGFQTLKPSTLVDYLMFASYDARLSSGVRYSDKFFSVRWPLRVSCISDRDRLYPDYRV